MLPDRLNAKQCALRCSETTSSVLLNAPEVVEQITSIAWRVYSCLQNATKSNYWNVQIWELLGVLASSPRRFQGPSNLEPYSPGVVLATGQGNMPVAWVWTGRTVRFGSSTIQKPDPQLLGSPIPAPYLSTCRFRRVWLDMLGPISGSAFRVFLFMVAFRYPTVNCKILTLVLHCHFLMYWQPLYSKQVERHSLPHPENERQWSVNNWWSCILGNLSGT